MGQVHLQGEGVVELALEALLAGAHHVVEVAPLVMEGVVVDPHGWVGVVADYHERVVVVVGLLLRGEGVVHPVTVELVVL